MILKCYRICIISIITLRINDLSKRPVTAYRAILWTWWHSTVLILPLELFFGGLNITVQAYINYTA